MVGLIQAWIFAVLAVVLFAVEVFALINALRFRPDAYVAAGRRTKLFWGLLTGLSVLLGFLALPYPVGGGSSMLLMIIGIVIAGVFLADVYPALRQVMGRSRRNRRKRRR
ncbi:DUF2516 domain-containing protein [Brachybacterium endophyticum]|uniref:DUF2516 domain-containing protein n=1 Tax=Brachybacterium endophyticum TaxID=2182385 RepID=A0A2U2RKY3_9MICO|nr:DUF2516 family protein [Brachybacterium endophyticum]PWH06523.1 DUF2516 domain-containing protein [Brachybacterium endophyticum]